MEHIFIDWSEKRIKTSRKMIRIEYIKSFVNLQGSIESMHQIIIFRIIWIKRESFSNEIISLKCNIGT